MFNWNTWKLEFFKDLQRRFKKLETTLSIVIQGPLHPRMRESVPIYLDIIEKVRHNHSGNLVISYWDKDDIKVIEDLIKDKPVALVINNYSEVSSPHRNTGPRGPNPWIYQNHTTHQGLLAVTGHYAIKVRSDEIYPNLNIFYDKLIEMAESDQGHKTITSNIFFRIDENEKFHPSDHIIAGTRAHLKKAFEISTSICKKATPKDYKFPEQVICHGLLRASGVDPKPYKSKKIMQENFEIIPLSAMVNPTWTCSERKYAALKISEAGWCSDINSL